MSLFSAGGSFLYNASLFPYVSAIQFVSVLQLRR